MPIPMDPDPVLPSLRLGSELAASVVRIADARDHAPLLTWVDATDDSRIELSAATAASWVSKVAGLLLSDLDPGGVVGHDLAGHWTAPLLALGAWRAGCAVITGTTQGADLVVALEERVSALPASSSQLLVVGPGPGARPTDPDLPSFPAAVLAEPDELVADPPAAHATAVVGSEPGGDLSTLTAALAGVAGHRMLLLDPLDDPAGLVALAAAAVHGTSLVAGRLAAAEDGVVTRLAEDEHVDVLVGTAARLRGSDAAPAVGRAAVPWPPPSST